MDKRVSYPWFYKTVLTVLALAVAIGVLFELVMLWPYVSVSLANENSIWGYKLGGNFAGQCLLAVVYFLILWSIFWVAQKILLVRAERWAKLTTTDVDDTIITVVKSIRPSIVFVLALYLAFRSLTLTGLVRHIVDSAAIVVVSVQVIIVLQVLIDYVLRRRLRQRLADNVEETSDDQRNAYSALQLLNRVAKVALWAVGALFVLSNLGVNVTSLVASLGIGGIAVALALQNILGDLFSSLAIYFDPTIRTPRPLRAWDKPTPWSHCIVHTWSEH